MPTAKRSRSSTSRSFKEPAALKRLNKSLDAAQQALTELRKDSGKGAQDLYKDLRSFVSNARRDTGKLGKALAKDFDQAQKRISKSATGSSSRTSASRSKSTRAKSSTARSKPRSPGSRSSTSTSSRRSS
jgi:hypothetical protein